MAKVFISYRRADSVAVTGRIYDRLVSQLGRDAVFKDVDDIPPGANFATYVNDVLRQCAVALVIIGPHWLDAGAPAAGSGDAGSAGRPRLENPQDWVRLEVETALALGLTLIPVLVEGGQVPKASELPESLQVLRVTNAVPVRSNDPDFTHDMERVVAGVRRTSTPLPERADPPKAKVPDFTTSVRHFGAATDRDMPSPVTEPAKPARTVGPQSKASLTATRRRISTRLVVVGVLLAVVLVSCSVALYSHYFHSTNHSDNFNLTGTWQLTEVLNGGQTVNYTLVLHQTNTWEVTGTLAAAPNLSLSLSGSLEYPQNQGNFVWLAQETINTAIVCQANFSADLPDGTHMVQGTISPTAFGGLCTDGAQFPNGATFTATKTS